MNLNYEKICVNCLFDRKQNGWESFHIIEKQNYQIFSKEQNWTGVEELLLLRGIQYFGFGNWGDIASLISKHSLNRNKKDKEKVKEHYDSVYMKKAYEFR